MPKIAILVLGCASGRYVELIDTIRRTWGQKQIANVDIYYLFGTVNEAAAHTALTRWLRGEIPTLEDGGICDVDKVLVTGCPDSIYVQEDCILRKRLIAFDYLAAERDYDFIHTVCAASYVDQYELVRHVEQVAGRSLVSGASESDTSGRAPFVSGASMLLSADVARSLASHRNDIVRENQFGFRDDVALGQWVAEHLSGVPMEETMDAIIRRASLPQDSIFVSSSYTTIDYVVAEADRSGLGATSSTTIFTVQRPKTWRTFTNGISCTRRAVFGLTFPSPEIASGRSAALIGANLPNACVGSNARRTRRRLDIPKTELLHVHDLPLRSLVQLA